jgi:hypothetical protein
VRLLPGTGAGQERHRVRVPVADADRAQEFPLPLGSPADGPGFLEQPLHAGHLPGRLPERVIEAHGDPPVAHHALGIGLDHLRERLLRLLVPEGVEDRDREVELLLGRGRARDREVDPPELARVTRGVDVLRGQRLRGGRLRSGRCRSEERQTKTPDGEWSHLAPPWADSSHPEIRGLHATRFPGGTLTRTVRSWDAAHPFR